MLFLLATFLYAIKKSLFYVNEFKQYTLYVVFTSLLHYETFAFIVICYLTSSLAIFHAFRGEKISIQHIEKKQELCNIV